MALWDFRNIFLPNTGEDPKKKSYLSAGPLALCPNGKSVSGYYCITLIKRFDNNFKEKTLNFSRVYTFKLVGKHYIEGARAPWINIIVGDPFKLGAI